MSDTTNSISELFHFEAVFLFLYDVGRSIDIRALDPDLRGGGKPRAVAIERRIDTPESLQLPIPVVVNLESRDLDTEMVSGGGFDHLTVKARLYEDGVVTIECRATMRTELNQLHTVRSREISTENGPMTLDGIAASHFSRLMGSIGDLVYKDQYRFDEYEREDYHIFCLTDELPDPHGFLQTHQDYLAPFLLGENPSVNLHASQVGSTLKTPFSFTTRDVAIFDMDRAFLIAPDKDYEDLILMVEHANYQLLELRTLDKLLDRLLDDAERDIRTGYRRLPGRSGRLPKSARTRPPRGIKLFRALGTFSKKLGNLQPLRLDALFILENLENSSRIIGDYYLEQIYGHLCGIFNTRGWKNNVERRLEILQSIYSMTKSDATDRSMVLMELLVVLLIAFEIIVLFFPKP